MGAVGWEVPLIMHCFCFSFADLSAADLSKSPSLHWRNLASSHGSVMGWQSDPSHHAILFFFFFGRHSSCKTGWVPPPKLKTGCLPLWAVVWDVPLIRHCFSLPFPDKQTEELGESSSQNQMNLGFPMRWQALPSHYSLFSSSFLADKWKSALSKL